MPKEKKPKEPVTGKRGPNWSSAEIAVLKSECLPQQLLLKSRFSDTMNLEKKNKAWATVSSKVSSLGMMRSASDCKKKWSNYQRDEVKKVRQYRVECTKTGTYVYQLFPS